MSLGQAVKRLLFGSQHEIAGTVYGTIVVMGALTAGSHDEPDPWRLATIAAATVLVLWVAHVYSHALAETINAGRRLDRAELGAVARRELPIVFAAVGPVFALALGALGVLRESTAVWLAFGIALATLVVEGFRYAGVEHYGRLATFVSVAVNLSLGLVIVALKVAVSH